MGKKCCCNKLPCCCGNSPREWVVDFGAGGWVDGRCDACDDVLGEFTLEHNTTITGHELTCLFAYLVDDWCDDALAGECDLSELDGQVSLVIALRIPLMNEFVPTCTITLRIELAQDLGEDGFCTALCYANYSGTFVKADFDGCFDDDFVPFTLTRESDACTANNNLGLLCSGRLPTSITIAPA